MSGTGPAPETRIGDAEREAAVTALGEHYAAGRLTREEYDERAESAWSARTVTSIRPLFADLPAPHPFVAAGRTAALPAPPRPTGQGRRGPRMPFVPLLILAIVAVFLLSHVWPLFLVIGLVWLLHSRGSDRACRGKWENPRRTA